MASISIRRRRANSRRPLTISPPAAPSAYSSAATCGDASSNSTGRPIENWRRPIDTRAADGPGAVNLSDKVIAFMRRNNETTGEPADGWRDAPRQAVYQVKPEPMRESLIARMLPPHRVIG